MSRQVLGGDFIGWSHLTPVFPCSLVPPTIQAAPWRSGARGDGALGIRTLLLLSAVVSARPEGLNIQLVMFVWFFLETLSGPSLHGSLVSLDVLLAVLQSLGDI